MDVIQLEQIQKTFQMGDENIRALDGVTLRIQSGEFVAITGASGCGKSTLMNILGLLDKPVGGKYILDGKAVETLTDDQSAQIRNQKIGFVFQSFNLLPRADALRNVEMPLVYSASWDKNYSPEKIREKAMRALSRVGLESRVGHLPSELSGGQRQRVAIARALVNDPKVILADEPTGNLDSKTGDLVLGTFQKLHRQGRTIVLITHEPYVAEHAERILVIRDGELVEDRVNKQVRQQIAHV